MATLEEDGWELESAEERHNAHPESFIIPSAQERVNLESGTRAKLLFLFMNQEEGKPIIDCERMHVIVRASRNGRYDGVLDDAPVTSAALRRGAIVEFGPEHVASIVIPRTDARHPESVRPTNPWWRFWSR